MNVKDIVLELDNNVYKPQKPSKLLLMMFETERWQNMIEIADEKGLNKKLIKDLCYPEARASLYNMIHDNKYTIYPPTVCKIPKDTPGEFREVYVNRDLDRIVLTLINDCLCEICKDMIHPNCVSYQKGIGTQDVVKRISKEIVRLSINISTQNRFKKQIICKSDFSKYFDTVYIEAIDAILNKIEDRLGFERGQEPVINLLRRYYHQDLYFDHENVLHKKYQSLKQGCAVASFLANAILYELDEYMSKKYKIYYRYSDDVCVVDENISGVIGDMNSIIVKYGVKLNPKKVELICYDKWFKFLGFNIKGDMITLSKNRLKKFQKEIESRSIKKNYTAKQARNAIFRYLYEGEYCWASSCLGTINVEKDINELNKFILDCIRACETGKKKIGGLGSVMDLPDRTILRGKGKNVKSNRNRTDKEITKYLSVNCLSKDIKISKSVFEAVVRNMKA